MNAYIKHEDPGHGWLQVPLTELQALGIVDKISAYSYTDGTYGYLEEDCDMTTFLTAKNGGVSPESWAEVEGVCHIKTIHTDNDSFVRGLRSGVGCATRIDNCGSW